MTSISNGESGSAIRAKLNAGLRPLPFFAQPALWERPALNIGGPSSAFNTWLNKGGQAFAVGTDANFSNGAPVNPGVANYAPGDTITLAGGTLAASGIPTPARAMLTVSDTQAVSASIVSAGTLGTPGAAVVTGTTGTGSLVQLNVTINGGGGIGSIDSIAAAGDYTANPTDPTHEPVTDGAALAGAEVNVVMGVLRAHVTVSGSYTAPPANPAAQLSSSGSGTGATFDVAYTVQAVATDNPNGMPLIMRASGAFYTVPIGALTALLKPIGAAPWTISNAFATQDGADIVAGNTMPCAPAIILYNSSSGKAIIFAVGTSPGANAQWPTYWAIAHYDDARTIAGPVQTNAGVLFSPYFGWWQIQNDGTDLTYLISGEGTDYVNVRPTTASRALTESLASFIGSVDYVGFGVDRGEMFPNLDTLSILWNWVET